MPCPLCAHRMIAARLVDEEFFGDSVVVKITTSRRCPACEVVITVVYPTKHKAA